MHMLHSYLEFAGSDLLNFMESAAKIGQKVLLCVLRAAILGAKWAFQGTKRDVGNAFFLLARGVA